MAPNIKSRTPAKPDLSVVPSASGTVSTDHNQKSEAERRNEAEGMQLRSYMNKWRELAAEEALIAKQLKEVRDRKSETANYAKAAIKVTRKQLDSYLADMQASKRDLIAEEETRRRHRAHLGIVTETQMELFGEGSPTKVKDDAAWRGDGYLAGMRMDPAEAPKGCAGNALQEWLGGHADGMKVMQDSINQAEASIQAKKDAELAANAAPPEPEPEHDPAAEARKLKASGFMDTTPPPETPESETETEQTGDVSAPPVMQGAATESF